MTSNSLHHESSGTNILAERQHKVKNLTPLICTCYVAGVMSSCYIKTLSWTYTTLMTQRFHACIIKILAHIYQGNVQVFAAKKKKGISLYVHQLQVEINNVYYIQSWMIYNNENEWITGKKNQHG